MKLYTRMILVIGLLSVATFCIQSGYSEVASPVTPVSLAQDQTQKSSVDPAPVENDVHSIVEAAKGKIPQEKSMQDHKATVSKVVGDVKILKKNSETWVALTEGSEIRIGDKVRTGKNSYVEIFYDDFYLNMARVAENTFAEFQALEPTRIHITSGSVYNILDGLPKHSSYMVSTPTSVAGVRGTRFVRAFDGAAKTDSTFVSHGVVEVEVAENYGSLEPAAVLRVSEGFGLVLDGQKSATARMDGAAPQPLQGDHLDGLNEITSAVRQHLTSYVGQREIERAEARWQEIRQVPEANRSETRFEKTDGQTFEEPINSERLLTQETPDHLGKKPVASKPSSVGNDDFRIVVPVRKQQS